MQCKSRGCSRELEQCGCKRGCSRCTSGYRCPRHGKDWAYTTGGGLFSSGRRGSGAKCRKCDRAVVNCDVCKGTPGRTHRDCGGTGQVCPAHGAYWK